MEKDNKQTFGHLSLIFETLTYEPLEFLHVLCSFFRIFFFFDVTLFFYIGHLNFSNDPNVSISMITTFSLTNYEDTFLGVLHQLLEISEGVGHAHLTLSLDGEDDVHHILNTSRK